jgi:hypothetical protein
MNVLESLMTVGCLVRSGSRHGMVDSFSKRTNEARVKFGADGSVEDIHFTLLRAGDDDSEEHVCGVITKQFPKDPWPEARLGGEARRRRHPRTEELWA